MTNTTVEIEVTVDMFVISPTHGAYIHIDSHIDSMTDATIFNKMAKLSTLLYYNERKLVNVSCFRGDSGKYFDNI